MQDHNWGKGKRALRKSGQWEGSVCSTRCYYGKGNESIGEE